MKPIMLGVLIMAVLVSALLVVQARHQARILFVELQALEQTRDELNEEWSRLQLEQSTWNMAGRIENLARTELEMQSPGPEQLILVPQ